MRAVQASPYILLSLPGERPEGEAYVQMPFAGPARMKEPDLGYT